jgi:hypothetical protein
MKPGAGDAVVDETLRLHPAEVGISPNGLAIDGRNMRRLYRECAASQPAAAISAFKNKYDVGANPTTLLEEDCAPEPEARNCQVFRARAPKRAVCRQEPAAMRKGAGCSEKPCCSHQSAISIPVANQTP